MSDQFCFNKLGVGFHAVQPNLQLQLLEAGRDRFEGRGIDLLNDPKVGELYLSATATYE